MLPDGRLEFYLGTHRAGWLARAGVPLFVSDRQLRDRRALPRAIAPWCLDSGGFSELALFASFQSTPSEYAERIERYSVEIGALQWAAPQDWMCEPWMLAKTGLSIAEHQRRTIQSVLELRALTDACQVICVLQGWTLDDYLRHVEGYRLAGIDLTQEPVVGVGSVCRRQGTQGITSILRTLALLGLRLHGFGVKTAGLIARPWLRSADSMAWSFAARKHRRPALRECRHRSCANCLAFALVWRARLLQALAYPMSEQLEMLV